MVMSCIYPDTTTIIGMLHYCYKVVIIDLFQQKINDDNEGDGETDQIISESHPSHDKLQFIVVRFNSLMKPSLNV